MSNKESAKSFLQMVATGTVKEAYEKFIASDFIHHNLYFKGDRQSLLDAMEEAHSNAPNKKIIIHHLYEDEDTVITHSQIVRDNFNEPNLSVIHIFKFKNDRIIELWDLGQQIPHDTPNKNGAF